MLADLSFPTRSSFRSDNSLAMGRGASVLWALFAQVNSGETFTKPLATRQE